MLTATERAIALATIDRCGPWEIVGGTYKAVVPRENRVKTVDAVNMLGCIGSWTADVPPAQRNTHLAVFANKAKVQEQDLTSHFEGRDVQAAGSVAL